MNEEEVEREVEDEQREEWKKLYFDKVMLMARSGEVSLPEDRAAIMELCKSAFFQRLLATLIADANAVGIRIVGVDLGTSEGICKATRLQGKAQGIVDVVDTILVLATESE
jgi:hypothetical protein